MAKIGILGGTFNPIHLGHIQLAKTAYSELSLDTIWFMPSKNPPHKDNKQVICEKNRVDMIRLTISKYREFELSTIELERSGTTYTSHTLEYLHKNFPKDEYYFIVGADSIYNIESWNRPHILFKLAHFVVAIRDNIDIIQLKKQCAYLSEKYSTAINVIHMDKLDISSSYIRQQYANNYEYDYTKYIEKSVHEYIIGEGLYNK